MTPDHIAAVRVDAKRAADKIASVRSPPPGYGTAPPGWAILLGALAGHAENLCDEVERLNARVAELEGPSFVAYPPTA